MRVMLTIALEKPTLPRDYRPLIRRLLESMLEQYGGSDMLKKHYNATPSSHAFSVYLPKCIFKGNIQLSSGYIKIIFSTCDKQVYDDFFAAAQHTLQKGFEISENTFTITAIVPVPEKHIESSTIRLRMLSPLIVQDASNTEARSTGGCLSIGDVGFSDAFRHSVSATLQDTSVPPEEIADLLLTPCEDEAACKETHILHKGRFYKTTLGMLRLSGEPRILNLLYQNGIGELRDEGFGLFELA